MRKKRVLLLSEGFGSGHTQAAHALAAGLRQLNPGINTKVMELGNFLNPTVGPIIVSAYRKTVSSNPKIVGLMYRSNYKKSLGRFTQLTLHRMFYTQTKQVIQQLKPDAVICTHPVPNTVIARLKRLGHPIQLYTVITDYDAHGSWVNQEVNMYFVSAQIVKDRLIEKGVKSNHIEVTGIPVHPKFWNASGRAEARAQLGLLDIPTALVMGGGWGLMREDSALVSMMNWRETTQLIFCVGSNEKMQEKLLTDPRFQHPNVHILSFTKDINTLMDAADLLITKPGGMTCTEGMSKGIPMLFYEPIPGQEEENCDYFIQNGFGQMLDSKDTIEQWLTLIQDPEEAQSIRSRLREKCSQQYDPQSCSKAVLLKLQ